MSCDEVLTRIQRKFAAIGYKFRTVSISHLPEIQDTVGKLVRQGLIAKSLYENWHYYLKTNDNLPDAKTIIVVAMPEPLTRLKFKYQGHTFLADVAPNYFFEVDELRAETILKGVLKGEGFKLAKAHLALKTLAVRSGLATYGKNNITYVDGMGSYHRLVGFYSDCPCEEDDWQNIRELETCKECSLCIDNCPTGSITTDRFLISAEKCPGSLAERNPDFPYWVKLQPGWDKGLIGCMSCQFICPENKPYINNIISGSTFSEPETDMILNKIPWEGLKPQTQKKLGELSKIYPYLAANLKALIEKQSVKHQ